MGSTLGRLTFTQQLWASCSDFRDMQCSIIWYWSNRCGSEANRGPDGK